VPQKGTNVIAFDFYVERDQLVLVHEFTADLAIEPQAGDTIDFAGCTWMVERRHLARNGCDVCVVVHRVEVGSQSVSKQVD